MQKVMASLLAQTPLRVNSVWASAPCWLEWGKDIRLPSMSERGWIPAIQRHISNQEKVPK